MLANGFGTRVRVKVTSETGSVEDDLVLEAGEVRIIDRENAGTGATYVDVTLPHTRGSVGEGDRLFAAVFVN